MSRRSALFALPLIVVLLTTSCARSVTLGLEEAVEVMVLDGVDRERATCVVSALDGRLDLRKVTGLDLDLDGDELVLLSATSAECAPALAPSAVQEQPPSVPLPDDGLETFVTLEDVEGEISRRVSEGLDPLVADCLVVRLTALPDPSVVLADDVWFSEFVVDCRADS